ncbi:hypothetical protein NOR_04558 [Metarhizium rileyi]|uniref:Uncharacterized protein n=1 Tax=Metarhizium rileyi (strain RCEF 4871) TaxID=1649241 RepID=A0A167E1W7_METRR|nr:hypothetical protein NOR_04558 [Metarhizium rileyi RCEF 4871]
MLRKEDVRTPDSCRPGLGEATASEWLAIQQRRHAKPKKGHPRPSTLDSRPSTTNTPFYFSGQNHPTRPPSPTPPHATQYPEVPGRKGTVHRTHDDNPHRRWSKPRYFGPLGPHVLQYPHTISRLRAGTSSGFYALSCLQSAHPRQSRRQGSGVVLRKLCRLARATDPSQRHALATPVSFFSETEVSTSTKPIGVGRLFG